MYPTKFEISQKVKEEVDELDDTQRWLENIGKFGADLGHDFNNILGSVLACIDLLRQKNKKSKAPEDQENILRMLEAATEKGMSITNKIRAYARPGTPKMSKVGLKSSIDCVIDVIRKSQVDKSESARCEIEFICPVDYEVEIAGTTIVQMLLQLWQNSADAMSHLKEKFIVFHVEKIEIDLGSPKFELTPGSYAKVSLVDHGQGIKEELQEAVFNPFFSTKSRKVGAGLGLSMSMAKAVMKQHGGTITLSSSSGIGTTISLFFPLR